MFAKTPDKNVELFRLNELNLGVCIFFTSPRSKTTINNHSVFLCFLCLSGDVIGIPSSGVVCAN